MTEHTHKQFDAEMESIRSGVLAMGGLVETQLSRAIVVLEKDEDTAILDLVGADELQINQMQVDMDQQCSQIIAKRQPAAIDLRMILTVTKIVNDLERVADEVKKVAYKAVQTRGNSRLAQVRYFDIARAAGRAKDMLQLALDAFARLDVSAAAEVIDMDDEIDAAFSAVLRQLISYMMEDPRTISLGAGDRVHRQVDRTHWRPCQEHRRGGDPGRHGQGRAPCHGGADPRRGGGGMSAAGPSQGANCSPSGGSERSERGGAVSVSALSQGANCSPSGGSAAALALLSANVGVLH